MWFPNPGSKGSNSGKQHDGKQAYTPDQYVYSAPSNVPYQYSVSNIQPHAELAMMSDKFAEASGKLEHYQNAFAYVVAQPPLLQLIVSFTQSANDEVSLLWLCRISFDQSRSTILLGMYTSLLDFDSNCEEIHDFFAIFNTLDSDEEEAWQHELENRW